MTREDIINNYIIPACERTWNEKICAEIRQALKQEPILDKIRAEICKTSAFYHGTELADGLDFAIKIVDKYKTESEVTE